MAGETDQNKLKCYYYHITISLLYGGKETKIDDNAITDLGVVFDFANNFFPILHLKMSIPHKTAYEMRECSTELMVRLKMFNYSVRYRDAGNVDSKSISSNAAKLNSTLILDQMFQPFNTDPNYYTQYSNNENPYNTNKLGGSNELAGTNQVQTEEMELYLFSFSGLSCNKKIVNDILGNCSIDTAVLYVLNYCGVQSAIISPSDNTASLPQIILPPLNLKKSIDSIQDNYGIYKIGLIQFHDFDNYYLLNKDYTQTIPVEGGAYEKVYIRIGKNNDLVTSRDGCYVDSSRGCYVINCYDNSSVTDNADTLKEGNGSHFQIMTEESIKKSVSYDEESDTFTFLKPYNEYSSNGDTNENSSDKSVMLYNDTENNFNEQALLNDRIENSTTITMNFANVDINLFKLNRKYVIQYDDPGKSRYNGIYRINNFGYGMSQSDFYIIGEFKKIVEI